MGYQELSGLILREGNRNPCRNEVLNFTLEKRYHSCETEGKTVRIRALQIGLEV
jgi:hypothetical protein